MRVCVLCARIVGIVLALLNIYHLVIHFTMLEPTVHQDWLSVQQLCFQHYLSGMHENGGKINLTKTEQK